MPQVAVEWRAGPVEGRLEVVNGHLAALAVAKGEGSVEDDRFAFTSGGPCRLVVTLDDVNLSHGAHPTIVSIRCAVNPFTVLLRDVDAECPIILPTHGVVVTEASDGRSYLEIEEAIRGRGLQTTRQRIESEEEESYAAAAAQTRNMRCPTWLGLSRDMRIFEVGYGDDGSHFVHPRFHGQRVTLPEADDRPIGYHFWLGRGMGCVERISRRLEDGVLPILQGELVDDDVTYNFTAFVSLESTPLTAESLRGTHFLVADGHGVGHTFTKDQEERFAALLSEEMNRDEDTVFHCRVQAVNTAAVPRYAWFMAPLPRARHRFDGQNGCGVFEGGGVFAVSKLDRKPLPQQEMAVLLGPGEAATFEFTIPHRPVSAERAARLAGQDFERRHVECRDFWTRKLGTAAAVSVPEKRISEMTRAGLLHLDLVAYGLEPDQPVAATIGVYCPIGSESAPIIQFMDSMGWHDLARRSLDYFLEKQHKDGFMQNFDGYMLETGAALWSIGEHYRYTHDDEWVKQIAPRLLKSCQYLLEWRKRNQREELRGKGYGMLDGKVADPEDPYHIYMLNGYAYLALRRTAEMLAAHDPAESQRLAAEAEALRNDIRTAFFEGMARSPAVPLGNGTWCPTVPPWAEGSAPTFLLLDGRRWFTHGTFTGRDSLIGPIYLIFQELLDPEEPAARSMIDYATDLLHLRNVAFSQPYYSRHPWVHLKTGQVKAFLKAYYNGFAGLADRETYTFWEHYFHASPHKTHEEGWFLMQTRWMLYMEEGETLRLLPGIPRAWMAQGERIELDNVASYFGPISLRVESEVDRNRIAATVACVSDRRPKCVELRLPHPQGRRAIGVTGGTYHPATESVRIEPFEGSAEVVLRF